MNVRHKITLAVLSALLGTALLNMLLLVFVVLPQFTELERDAALQDAHRVINAIHSEQDDVLRTSTDYATWDESFRFAHGKHLSYVEDNLYHSSVMQLSINKIAISDRSGTVLYEATYKESADDASIPGTLALAQIDPDRILMVTSSDDSQKGLIITELGPMIITSAPILPSTGEGPHAGTFVMGRLLGDSALAMLRDRTRVEFDLLPIDHVGLDKTAGAALDILLQSDNMVVDEISKTQLVVFGLLRDLHGEPALLLRAIVGRNVSQTGQQTVLTALGGTLIAGVIAMVVLLTLLQSLVVGPISGLAQHLMTVGRSGDLSRRLASDRTDEIGTLHREFDDMLRNLAEARNRLVEQSYSSGIAEMASGVLHNIRNQLAPISMRVGRLRKTVSEVSHKNVVRAVAELKAPTLDPARKTKLIEFIEMANQQYVAQQSYVINEMQALLNDYARVEQTLSELDKFSRRVASNEAIELVAVVKETIGLLPQYPDIQIDIRVDPAMEDCPLIFAERFLIKQIVHNLFVNAIESMILAGKVFGTINVCARTTSYGGKQCLVLQIQDQGVGIEADKLEKIFGRGFSTKKGERRGLGLHWCANSIISIGGKIYAESPGPNEGATMHLLIPTGEALTTEAA